MNLPQLLFYWANLVAITSVFTIVTYTIFILTTLGEASVLFFVVTIHDLFPNGFETKTFRIENSPLFTP
jgi:hypothetical protein